MKEDISRDRGITNSRKTSTVQGLPSNKKQSAVEFDQVVPIADNFDYTKVDPIPYRPFQTKQHVAMGETIEFLCCSALIELGN